MSARFAIAREVPEAMPPLDPAPPLSRFEFWPMWRFYPPVIAWCLWLSIRHRGLRLPLIANPHFPAGGLVGESKSAILDLINGEARRNVAAYVRVERDADPAMALARALKAMRWTGLAFPIVAKPDIGCRGAGVRPVRSQRELAAYLAAFPAGEALLLQRLVDVEGEVGLFYVRQPGAETGEIASLTLKHFPRVTGDGTTTIADLIHADPRAGRLPNLYLRRFADRLDWVPARGESVRLAFAGSHSKGAIFRDGARHITPELTARIDAIARAIPDFHFGRFDIRFADFEAFLRGRDLTIVECNGAGAEATHIWDSRTRLRDAWQSLFRQYALLWEIGAANRRRGFRPEPWRTFLRRWRREVNATSRYPETA